MMRGALLIAFLGLAACGKPEAPTPEPVAAAKPAAVKPVGPDVKLYAMDCGHFHVKDAARFSDTHDYDGQARDLVDPCYLIRHPSGDLIWDFGIPPRMALAKPDPKAPSTITLTRTLEQQLGDLGLVPDDIEFIAISHSHYDHLGSVALFPDARWITSKAERDWMFRDEARQAENFGDYAILQNSLTLQIDNGKPFDVFRDGSVQIIQAPGHTPGHQVLLVKTAKSGNVILAGDMWHLAEAREKRTVPAFNFDKAQTLASMDKVEALAKEYDARVIRQHVPEDFAALPKFPKALE
jgi:N-acyl homoserine lactone hydrolase